MVYDDVVGSDSHYGWACRDAAGCSSSPIGVFHAIHVDNKKASRICEEGLC